jgi:hypothetical protein
MQVKYSGNSPLWQAHARLHRPPAAMVSCQSHNAVLALRRDFISVVMPGLDPGIHLPGRELDCRIKSGNDEQLP